MTEFYADFYNDVFGPIMQPFSSSHTAAPCRLGHLAHCLLGEPVEAVRIQTDPAGSFAQSARMMNTDLALLSGATGHLPADQVMFSIVQHCRDLGITYEFDLRPLAETDFPSAAKFCLTGRSGRQVELVGTSSGGGLIETVAIDGFPLRLAGDTFAVLLFDRSGRVESDSAFAALAGHSQPTAHGTQPGPAGGRLHWWTTSEPIDQATVRALTGWADAAVLLPSVAVVRPPAPAPQLFASFATWRALAKERGATLAEVAIDYEVGSSGWPRSEVVAYMDQVVRAKMHRTTHAVLDEPGIEPAATEFTAYHYAEWQATRATPLAFVDSTIAQAFTYAMVAQAAVPGVEFVPGPMGPGGGLVYSSLSAVREAKDFSPAALLRGLFVAAGLGAVAFSRTTPGGVNIGCAGEQGICSAMAAAGIVEMAGGTPEQVGWAASYALQVSVGWPCDPIPGGRGQPCFARALTGVANAIFFAQLALSGRDAVLPVDEVLDAADRVGRALKRTDQARGLVFCPTSQVVTRRFLKWHADGDDPAFQGRLTLPETRHD
jgi:L-serine dehydratase